MPFSVGVSVILLVKVFLRTKNNVCINLMFLRVPVALNLCSNINSLRHIRPSVASIQWSMAHYVFVPKPVIPCAHIQFHFLCDSNLKSPYITDALEFGTGSSIDKVLSFFCFLCLPLLLLPFLLLFLFCFGLHLGFHCTCW